MPCNLNFNQCNSFINFPAPIFNCWCRLASLLNSSTVTIINPVVVSSNASFNAAAQTIIAGGDLVVTLTSSSETAITTDGAGNISLPTGRYLITSRINGIIPASGEASYALYQNGVQIDSSISRTSGTGGANYTISMSEVAVVTNGRDNISLRNISAAAQTINNASMFIQKLS